MSCIGAPWLVGWFFFFFFFGSFSGGGVHSDSKFTLGSWDGALCGVVSFLTRFLYLRMWVFVLLSWAVVELAVSSRSFELWVVFVLCKNSVGFYSGCIKYLQHWSSENCGH